MPSYRICGVNSDGIWYASQVYHLLNSLTMLGGFTCPYCMEDNACTCETCKPYIKEGEFINTWTEDGQAHICGNCKKIYTPDAGLDAQWKKYMLTEKKQA